MKCPAIVPQAVLFRPLVAPALSDQLECPNNGTFKSLIDPAAILVNLGERQVGDVDGTLRNTAAAAAAAIGFLLHAGSVLAPLKEDDSMYLRNADPPM
jgi:hypothetical protein